MFNIIIDPRIRTAYSEHRKHENENSTSGSMFIECSIQASQNAYHVF